MRLNKKIQIAIDGPVAAGKGTVARALAEKLNILYVYTGAMYRAAAILASQHSLNLKDEDKIMPFLKQSSIKLSSATLNDGRFCNVFLNGKDITKQTLTPEVGWGASTISTLPKVRKHLVKLQQQMAKKQSVIMEGRDITTVVLPQADLKIYLTASFDERVRRRWKQNLNLNIKKTTSEVRKEIRKRDQQDKTRAVTPLKVDQDAWLLKTTHLSIDQVVNSIIQRLSSLDFLKKDDII